MNERIRELAIQVGAGEWGDSVIPAMMDIEKFAELIILECAEFVGKQRNDIPACGFEFEDAIKDHFGVK